MQSPSKSPGGSLGATGSASAVRRGTVAALCLIVSLVGSVATATPVASPAATVEASASVGKDYGGSTNDLLRAALEASGESDPTQLRRYLQRFAQLAAELQQSIASSATTTERAQAVLNFLHERILTGGYDAECHDPRRALDAGSFNCVGSSLLFHCLAERCGLDVRAVLVTGHVWCRITTDDGDFDVETTYPAAKPERQKRGQEPFPIPACSPAQVTVAASEKVPVPSSARELDDAGLVALVYYNRSVVELHAEHYAEAASAARTALELDPATDLARDNLAASYNNWAVSRSESGDHKVALELLAEARAITPHDERLTANARRIYARSYEAHLAAGEYFEASAIVAAAISQFPNEAYFVAARNKLSAAGWPLDPLFSGILLLAPSHFAP